MPPCANVYHGSKDIDGGGLGHIISRDHVEWYHHAQKIISLMQCAGTIV
jgi:hypothetical protein